MKRSSFCGGWDMSGLELLADEIDGRLHVAVTQKGRLANLYVDAIDRAASWASVHLGKVAKIDQRLDAAIVDLGEGLTGFLPAKHVHFRGADASASRSGIADLVRPGQTLMVQVKAEAKKDSDHAHRKLPRLTTKLYAFGQSLVYSPTSSQVTISRRISSENLIKLTNKLKGSGGWIVQQNAEAAREDDILFEAQALLSEWKAIAAASESQAPRLLRAGPHALQRALCDYGAFRFEHIHVANKALLDLVIAWCNRFQPALATSKRLRLFRPEKPDMKLFDLHDVYSVLETLSDRTIALPAGGSIIIEPTQAFTVIDVNQGSGGKISAINQDAAREVARQMRLRNLSGAVLVDFINMNLRSERAQLVELLGALLSDDYGSAEVHGFTRLGIIELTRKRRGATLAEKLKS